MKQVSWVEGDTAGPLTATLTTAGNAQNVDLATVTAIVRNVSTQVAQEFACNIDNASGGVVSVPGVVRGAWPAGQYTIRFKVVYIGGEIDFFPSDGAEPVAMVLKAWPVTP